MRKIHVTLQFFEASGPKGHFFEKNIFRYGLGMCVPNFRSVLFFVGPGVPVQTNKPIDTFTSEIYEYPRMTARLTWILIV